MLGNNVERLLLRQIHPVWVVEGRVTSQAYTPFPKDNGQLSVDDGDRIDAERSYVRYSGRFSSIGIQAVSRSECDELQLPVLDDPLVDNPEHLLIDFTSYTRADIKAKAKILRGKAELRGWLVRGPI